MDLQLGRPPVPERPGRLRTFIHTLGRRIRETYRYDTLIWRTGIAGPWMACFAAVAAAMLGSPTGLGKPADLLLAAGIATALLAAAGHLAAALLALAGLRLPRLFTGCLLGSAGIVMVILCNAHVAAAASAVIAGAAAALGALAGAAAGLVRTGRIVPGLLILAALASLPFIPAGGFPLPGAADRDSTEAGVLAADTSASAAVVKLAEANPGAPGAYAYRSFTYAGGSDRHRAEYGKAAAVLSSSVNASSYIKKWPPLRKLFWGFGPESLPLNGRVWMPEGNGPFPLVLIVHGNHMMEDFSDGGYDYLGELLASRGFIAISLDENFLNYSVWSGIPEEDYKLRAWMILKHLEQLAGFSDKPGNPFYNKIDFAETALIGHSRGGQAVAMAADAQRWFKGDPVLESVSRFHISAVAALAPTDQTVGSGQARLRDISYMTLQGARDGDVHDFYGDRQYNRSVYSGHTDAFKTSLYIGDANHSQFNSDWGMYDLAFPTGLFLSRSRIMDGEEQRQIAKVYISAFLEAALHGRKEYAGLFRDYRRGLEWLPKETSYFNRYQDGGFRGITDFEEDRDKTTAGQIGTISAAGLRFTEETAKDREGEGKGTFGAFLERGADDTGEAFYRISLKAGPAADAAIYGADGLTFSMANRNAGSGSGLAPQVEVELADRSGNKARLPLTAVMPPLPLPKTQFTRTAWLEKRISDGKYGNPSEAVFQTYELSFSLFREKNPSFNPAQLAQIAFHLLSGKDAVMLDDIGLYSSGTHPSLIQTALIRNEPD
ncbi:alpha/beta hydrolase [Paenibacillus sp. 7124]|uniref:Alpha/beta hydrolase n=1 Tax=Paenibacillus apii TaxID=1850370 RepID=A0A6M1PPG7_9BACL|nr:alpha/beta hydrolase [Paenibacillus apii]NGM85096.1 alpha/beta hydrolase [Paenibacillus apii]